MVLPSWISAAAALVTCGVTRLVAPVWSSGPNGEGATTDLQSACASAGADSPSSGRSDSPTQVAKPTVLTIVSPLFRSAQWLEGALTARMPYSARQHQGRNSRFRQLGRSHNKLTHEQGDLPCRRISI